MDKRKVEIDETLKVVSFLAEAHPELFELSTYTHPVKGVCTSVIMKQDERTTVDIENIEAISIEITQNKLVIITQLPQRIFRFQNFIKDETVM